MMRTPALSMLTAFVVAAGGCPPSGGTNCTYTVQLAQHPGMMFHGAGVPAAGGDYSVDVQVTPSSCSVPTSASDSWITITQEVPDRGLGYRITAAPNTAAVRRTGTTYVGYQALVVDQAGTGGSGCTFQIVPSTASFNASGGLGAFVIVPSDQRCGWTAERSSGGEDWSTEPRPIKGVGTTGIVFTVRSTSQAPQPPTPRQADVRVTDSANANVGMFHYSQQ